MVQNNYFFFACHVEIIVEFPSREITPTFIYFLCEARPESLHKKDFRFPDGARSQIRDGV